MPCQDEALKDRSSMPPVSVTMQPRNFPAVAAVVDDGLGVLAPDELAELAPGALVAEPHAASSATALIAAAALSVALTGTSYAMDDLVRHIPGKGCHIPRKGLGEG